MYFPDIKHLFSNTRVVAVISKTELWGKCLVSNDIMHWVAVMPKKESRSTCSVSNDNVHVVAVVSKTESRSEVKP